MRWLDSVTDLMDKLQKIVKDREAWHAAVHRIAKSRTQISDGTTASGDKLRVSKHIIMDFCL